MCHAHFWQFDPYGDCLYQIYNSYTVHRIQLHSDHMVFWESRIERSKKEHTVAAGFWGLLCGYVSSYLSINFTQTQQYSVWAHFVVCITDGDYFKRFTHTHTHTDYFPFLSYLFTFTVWLRSIYYTWYAPFLQSTVYRAFMKTLSCVARNG